MRNSLLRLVALAGSAVALLLLYAPGAQAQSYVARYDVFAGYTYLNSPHINLGEPGFHIQAGFRPKTWYSLGFDYSRATGDMLLTPGLLPDALQASLKAQLAQLAQLGMLPPGYQLAVKANSETQTFAAGPQLSFRKWSMITPFIRPSLGAIKEVAVPKPGDAIAKGIVAKLAPSGKKTDWQGFYGVGGGFDINATKHVVLRVQADFVYDHLFNDILKDGRNTVRFSIGPAFNFGKNIAQ